MQSPNLMKLASTLSPEERYKLIVPDVQREESGEKPRISEAERSAILFFNDKASYMEYHRRILIYSWVNILWWRDIEYARLRVQALTTMLVFEMDSMLRRAHEGPQGDGWNLRFKMLRETVAGINDRTKVFYAYRDAIPLVEKELWSVPFYDPARKATLARWYEKMGEQIADHNEMVNAFCSHPDAPKLIGPMMKDKGAYLIKEPVPRESS